jgi:hypothetical protein
MAQKKKILDETFIDKFDAASPDEQAKTIEQLKNKSKEKPVKAKGYMQPKGLGIFSLRH